MSALGQKRSSQFTFWMSAKGQKRTSAASLRMSALGRSRRNGSVTTARRTKALRPKAEIVGAMAGDADAIAEWQCG